MAEFSIAGDITPLKGGYFNTPSVYASALAREYADTSAPIRQSTMQMAEKMIDTVERTRSRDLQYETQKLALDEARKRSSQQREFNDKISDITSVFDEINKSDADPYTKQQEWGNYVTSNAGAFAGGGDAMRTMLNAASSTFGAGAKRDEIKRVEEARKESLALRKSLLQEDRTTKLLQSQQRDLEKKLGRERKKIDDYRSVVGGIKYEDPEIYAEDQKPKMELASRKSLEDLAIRLSGKSRGTVESLDDDTLRNELSILINREERLIQPDAGGTTRGKGFTSFFE